MQDNALIQVFAPIIEAGLTTAGYTNVTLIQSNQPTLQGVDMAPIVFFFKVTDKRYGFMKSKANWDNGEAKELHQYEQMYETTFQIGCLAIQDPADISKPTAADILNSVAFTLQNDTTIETLRQSGVQILRILNVENPYFTDDRDRFEAAPHFDFVLIHPQNNVTIDPTISDFVPGIYPT